MPISSSGKGPRVSMDNSGRGVTLYKWWSTKSSQSACLFHLIFWQIIHSDMYFFRSSFIPIQLCPQIEGWDASLRVLYVQSTPVSPSLNYEFSQKPHAFLAIWLRIRLFGLLKVLFHPLLHQYLQDFHLRHLPPPYVKCTALNPLWIKTWSFEANFRSLAWKF